MSNKGLIWFVALGFVVSLNGCTFGGEQSDDEAVESIEATDEGLSADDGAMDDALISDSLPEDALGESTETAGEAMPSDSGMDMAEAPAEGTDVAEPPSMVTDDSAGMVADAPPPETTPAQPMESEPPPTDMAGTVSEETPAEEEEAPKPKPMVPLQKVASQPWKVGRAWVNGVYFARPGDTLASVSQTLYGADETAMLQRINPTYKSREPRPGDKIYYSSPKRPEDNQNLLTYYEDIGQQPEMYFAKDGDNIRSVARELLGYDGAWKEVWASNSVESKGEIEEGTQLRFWRTAASSQPMANAEAPPAQDMMAQPPPEMPPAEMAPPPQDMAAQPPPEMPSTTDTAMNELPPPPPMPEAPAIPEPPPQAMSDIPPPPPIEALPPPPPPPPPPQATTRRNAEEEEMGGMDQDTMITLGMVAIAAAGVAALLVVRRRRKGMEQQIGETTQVGT